MKTMKRVLIALVVCALCLPLFANGGSEASASTKESGPVTINLWYGAAMTEAGAIPNDWAGYQILKDKFNIDLKLTALPSNESDQDVKIQAAGAGNNLPDLFMVSRKVLTNLVKQGLVATVDDMYEMMPTRTAIQYDADSIAHTTINGHSYGLASPGSIVRNEGLLIRKDWLDKLGLEVPTNTDELMEVMRAFTFNDPDGNGKNDTYGYGAFVETNAMLKGYPGSRLWPVMGAFDVAGLWNFTAENAGLNIYRPEFYDAMCYIKQMCDEGVIDPNWLSYKKDDFRAAWKQGRFGVMYEQNAAYASTANYAPFDKNFPEGEWVICDAITGPDGHAAIGAYDQNYRIYAVSAQAAKAGKKQAIAQLLEWMSSDEGYFLCGWGVEGVNYELVDGIPTSTEALGENGFTGTKGQVYTQLRNMVFYNSDTELASRYPTYITEVSGKEMSALKVLREMQSKKWVANLGSGTMPTANADVQRFYEQSLAEFLSGSKPLNETTWAKFIDDFNAIGGKAWNDQGVQYMKDNSLIK